MDGLTPLRPISPGFWSNVSTEDLRWHLAAMHAWSPPRPKLFARTIHDELRRRGEPAVPDGQE